MEVYDNSTVSNIRKEFKRLENECYLDQSGASLYSEVQIKNVMSDFSSNIYGNPHSLSQCSKGSTELVNQVRRRLLTHFHTSPEEYSIIFTSGATGAIKLVFENFDWKGEVAATKDTDDEFVDVVCNHVGPCRPGSTNGTNVHTHVNHTSVVGSRELAALKGVQSFSIQEEYMCKMWPGAHHGVCRHGGNSIFTYPAQCNFSGKKYPMSWIERVHEGALDNYNSDEPRLSRWYVLLDAATHCSTNELNLTKVRPDFVCLSFYKIFGYPTGLGALLVRNESLPVLNKTYFGGGTVDVVLPTRKFHRLRNNFERFEDGTISFLSIIALNHGLSTLTRLNLTMELISKHVFNLAQYTASKMRQLVHWNKAPLVELYSDSDFDDIATQGGIVNFNLKRAGGEYIGFMEVLHIANLYKIHLRTGCFCNTGACQKYLNLSDEDLLHSFEAGHVCGDERDLVDGRPTGSIRVSFGYMNRKEEADKLLNLLKETFLETAPTLDNRISSATEGSITLKKIFIYPIKSCGAMEVSEWNLNDRGLEYDREWMVVTKEGIALTQKNEPLLCLVLPYVDLKHKTLTLHFRTKGHESVTMSLDRKDMPSGKAVSLCESKVCGDRVLGEDCGEEVAVWLDQKLNKQGLRLIRQGQQDGRTSKISQYRNKAASEEEKLSLSNQAQFLLINQNSVSWLTHHIESTGDICLNNFADRFRGNFLIEGAKEFLETEWKAVSIGKVNFKVDGACTRCQMICIDQRTGQKNRQPLAALARALNGKLRFGIYLTNTGGERRIYAGQQIQTS